MHNHSIKLVIFDLDGTLIKFHQDYLYLQAEKLIEKKGHGFVERSIMEEHFSSFDFFKFVQDEHREEFMEHFWQQFDWDNFPKPEPILGVIETLDKLLAKDVVLAIATSRLICRDILSSELKDTGLVHRVSKIVTRTCEESEWSDKTKQLKEVIDAFSFKPDEVAMVGDIPPDIKSASNLGIKNTVGVLSGGIKKEVLKRAKPRFILPDVSSLYNCLFP